MAFIQKFELLVTIDKKTINIVEDGVEVNHPGGKERQLASLFYRAMLAAGISPHNAAEAMGREAAASGYSDETQGALPFETMGGIGQGES